MIKLKRDQITGAVLVILGFVVMYLVSQFSTPMTAAYPGSKLLPSIAAFGFIVCGSGVFIFSTLNKKEESKFLTIFGWGRVGISILILAAYVLAMTYVGYLISTPIVLYVLVTLFAKESKSKMAARIIFSVVFTVALYLIYVYAFGLGLPVGAFFE